MGPSEKPLDPRLSNRLELVRTILGRWAEPVLVAYGSYAPHAEQPASRERMLQVCCDAAREIAQAVGAAIAVVEGSNLTYVAKSGDLVSAVGARGNAEAGFPGACVNSRKVFLSNHALTDRRVDPSVRRRGIKSLIAVPMVEKGEVLGYFEVFSRIDNALNVSHIVSLQFMASLVGQALSQSRLAKKSDAPLSVPAAVFGSESEFLRPGGAIVSSAAPAVSREPARFESPVSPPVAELQTATTAVRKPDPPIPEPTVSSVEPSTETVEQPRRISEAPSPAAPASAKSSTERRAQTRTLVDSLVYVSLGEENGGILLDVNDAGFSMQTAFPLDPGNPHLRRARFSGNGDFEIDCELAWDQSGQAGFRFPNTSADLRGRLRAWIAANGIAVSSPSATVPKPERTQLAASALAQLDELRSMLLNSKLTLEGLKK